jgi:hypothetical protein
MAALSRALFGAVVVSTIGLLTVACSSDSSSGSGAPAVDSGTVPSIDSGVVDGAAPLDSSSEDGSSAPSYDALILADHPVAYWAMSHASGTEPDLTGHGNTGTYVAGTKSSATLPNGDLAADFDGATQYLTVQSNASFSIPTKGMLTWEAWIRPDVLQFPHDDGTDGFVDWMGKCEQYAPTCEWEARMYDLTTNVTPNRPNRLSAYVFNPSAGLGSGADWQPASAVIAAGQWLHVVGEYTTQSAPADCANTATYPGSIDIWVNGVRWDHASHGSTGCMSQYSVVPKAGNSALNIGTMAKDSWFSGAIGKVAIYGALLSDSQIVAHYAAMTGKQPKGSCAATCTF